MRKKNVKGYDQDDALKAYFEQIKNTQLLTFEEELELSRRIRKGDEDARQKLIKSNLRLVVKMAKSFATPDVHFIDLVQEGNLGLIKAASKYDYRKGVRFSTYASWWIKQSITRALSNKRRTIRLPHRKEEALKKIQKAYTVLNQEYMRKPTVAEIAEEVNMEVEEVKAVLSMSGTVVSLNSELTLDSGTLMDIYEDQSFSPDKELLDKSLREETMKFLERLMEKERQILMYRFAFYGGKRYTLKKIGQELGISPETVRQIEMRALKKLKDQADELKEFIHT